MGINIYFYPIDGRCRSRNFNLNDEKNDAWMVILSGLFLLLSGLIWFIQQYSFDLASSFALVVPDSINLSSTLQELWIKHLIFDLKSGFWAIAVVYGWTWLIHPALCFLVNVLLMVVCAFLFRRILVRLNAPAWSVIGLLANPYLMLAMPGPNKEIPLLLLTLLLAENLFKYNRKFWLAAAYCIPIYLLRDGYGLLMALLVIVTWLSAGRERLVPMVVLVMAVMIAALWLPLSSLVPVMARNTSIYNSVFEHQEAIGAMAKAMKFNPFDPLGGAVLYSIKIVYNLVSMAFFPVFLTKDNHLYGIGIAYWIYGLMIFVSVSGCVWQAFCGSGNRSLQLATSITLCVWFLVSLSLFIQPRYLMPVLPLAFSVFAALPARARMVSITLTMGMTLAVILAYAVAGRTPPAPSPDLARAPAYLIEKSFWGVN